MTGNTTTTPSPRYLLHDRTDPANPRIVIASGRISLPVGCPDPPEMSATSPAVELMATLHPANQAWVDNASDAELAGWERLDTTGQ